MEYLLEKLEDYRKAKSGRSQMVVDLIGKVIESEPRKVGRDDLVFLSRLPDVLISVERGHVGPHDDQRPVYEDERFDCSSLRTTALAELERRGEG